MSRERRNPNNGKIMEARPEVKGYRIPKNDAADVPAGKEDFDDALPDFWSWLAKRLDGQNNVVNVRGINTQVSFIPNEPSRVRNLSAMIVKS